MNKSDAKLQKKNVSFIEANSPNDTFSELMENEAKNKPILKNNSMRGSISPASSATSSSQFSPKSCDLGNTTIGDESVSNEKTDSSILVSANNKNKKTEGYEILVIFLVTLEKKIKKIIFIEDVLILKTIKAKLKQRVGQNRTKAVELHDIDSIMRNVVTIIQDEFMKRFPSGPAVSTAIRSS